MNGSDKARRDRERRARTQARLAEADRIQAAADTMRREAFEMLLELREAADD